AELQQPAAEHDREEELHIERVAVPPVRDEDAQPGDAEEERGEEHAEQSADQPLPLRDGESDAAGDEGEHDGGHGRPDEERRAARAHPAQHGEPEVQERQEHDEQRKQDGQEGTDQLRASEALRVQRRGVHLPGDRDGRCRHEQADHERTGVAHEQLRRAPVQRQEPEARPDEDRGEERGEVEVARGTGVAREDVRVREEHPVGDQADAGDETVQPVDEVHGVHDDHDREHRDRDAQPARHHDEVAERQGEDLQAATHGDDARGEELRAELDHPVDVPEVVHDPDHGDEEGGRKDGPHGLRGRPDALEEGVGRRDRERGHDAEEDRDATEAGRRRGVHVALADAGIQLEAQAQPPHRPRQHEGDRGGDDDREEVLLHESPSCGSGSSRSPRTSRSCSLVTTPSRRTRTTPGSASEARRTSEVASMIVEATPFLLMPSSRYTATLSPSIFSASSAEIAAALPVRLALDTASGPVSASSSRTTRPSGMRTATVPLVSPRSHTSEGCAGRTIVRPPGQKASTRRWTGSGTSSARAVSVSFVPTRTGGG
ncbi:unnamed protein product, partial [Penicillium discolor]